MEATDYIRYFDSNCFFCASDLFIFKIRGLLNMENNGTITKRKEEYNESMNNIQLSDSYKEMLIKKLSNAWPIRTTNSAHDVPDHRIY